MSVILDKAQITLPEDSVVGVVEHAYQITLPHIPGLFFLNLGSSLAAGMYDDYDHRETSIDLNRHLNRHKCRLSWA